MMTSWPYPFQIINGQANKSFSIHYEWWLLKAFITIFEL